MQVGAAGRDAQTRVGSKDIILSPFGAAGDRAWDGRIGPGRLRCFRRRPHLVWPGVGRGANTERVSTPKYTDFAHKSKWGSDELPQFGRSLCEAAQTENSAHHAAAA